MTRQGKDKEGGEYRRERRWGGEGAGKVDKIRLLQPLKSLVVVVVVGGVESDYSVCPRPLLQFYAYLCQTG